jgi:CRISPR-associated endonuclease Cas2
MRLMLCYDVLDPKRLRRVEKLISGQAQRLQDSLYEADFDPAQLESLQRKLLTIIDRQVDSVRYYPVCSADLRLRTLVVKPNEIDCFSGWMV